MNNYIKLLLHLKTFEGDGKEHPVEHLFPDLLTDDINNILTELSDEGLIKFSGREKRYLSFVFTQNIMTGESQTIESPNNENILKSDPKPFTAKITFKGSKYLKEELQMQEAGKYNFSLSGQGATNNIVIESKNVTINNKADFSKRVDNIINTLQSDKSVDADLKNKAVQDLQLAKTEVDKNGQVPPDLLKTILEYGSNISSIGQLVLSLLTA